jgi:LuxR family quorum sensing-dependent transcriptional regulator
MLPVFLSTEIVEAENTWKIADLHAEGDVRSAFESICARFGFRGFAIISMPVRPAPILRKLVVMTNWPAEVVRQYDTLGLLKTSLVFQQLRHSTVPFVIDNRVMQPGMKTQHHGGRTLFADAGYPRMVFIPVHDSLGRRSTVAFGGDRPALSREELNSVLFIAGHVYNRLSEIQAASRRTPGSLSRREVECLRLAAGGKTTVEMARILSLSEYTVNHYLNRATRKLDSVNRVQTIAKALRAGLIM